MSTKQKVFIFRDIEVTQENQEELQGDWLETMYPDRIIIGGENNEVVLIDEENESLMCMEYTTD